LSLLSQAVTKRSSTTGLRFVTAIILLLLAAEFMIGIVVNLFITVPSSHPGTNASEYFSGVLQGVYWALLHAESYLWVHVIIGLALFLTSIILLIMSIVARRGGWITTSIIGLIGVVGAGFNGASFLNYNEDFSSLLMSVGFLLAAMAYVVGFSVLRD
jgi:1,4-dihydroxy-2-naphthoate octaprenyltransferase